MSERYTKGNREDDLTGFCGCGKTGGSKDFKCDCDSCRSKPNRNQNHGHRGSHCDCESCRRKRMNDRDVAGERDRHDRHPCEWERVDHERERHYAREGRSWVKFSWERNCECRGCVQNRHQDR